MNLQSGKRILNSFKLIQAHSRRWCYADPDLMRTRLNIVESHEDGGDSMNLLIKQKPMEKWDGRFCELAKFVSEWSKDPKAKVGAVIFSKRGGDIAIGYNGFPIGVKDSTDRLNDSELKLEIVVHAEQNAIIAAGNRTQGATLYVWGKPVCARCAGSIIQAGIKRIVALSPEAEKPDSKWRASGNTAYEMFVEAGVEVDFYVVEEATEEAQQQVRADLGDPGAPLGGST